MKSLKKEFEKFKKLDKSKKGYLIAAALITIILGWAFISAGVITGNFNRAQIKNGADSQKVNANGIIITETKDGTKYFELYGESGNYNNQDKVAILNNVIGNFYKDNEVSMSFQSSKGSYNEKSREITLFENTYIVLKDATSLEADHLVWSGSDKDTIAKGNVRIKKGNELLSTAEECIIRAGYDSFKIKGNTKTQIFDKKQGE
jgi:LPS export ABC transporter protein LptC